MREHDEHLALALAHTEQCARRPRLSPVVLIDAYVHAPSGLCGRCDWCGQSVSSIDSPSGSGEEERLLGPVSLPVAVPISLPVVIPIPFIVIPLSLLIAVSVPVPRGALA